jgi:hypothetical protein
MIGSCWQRTITVWTTTLLVPFIFSSLPGNAAALELSGGLSLEAVNLSGENTYKTTFDGGHSLLKWPIDVKTVGIELVAAAGRTAEVELVLYAKPWMSSNGLMKDYDYLDESRYFNRAPHDGTDIYSESKVDSRAMVFQGRARIFPLQRKLFSAGFSAGYEYQEFDYHAYNTRQVGYGPWSDRTGSASGLVSQYFLQYDMYSLGLTFRSNIDDIFIFTLDASYLPYVTAKDEDDHLRRNRVSLSDTRGNGYQAEISGLFKVYKRLYLSSRVNVRTIRTDGSQNQYWYGDDPSTSNFNDTGSSFRGVGVRIDQESLLVTVGAQYRF